MAELALNTPPMTAVELTGDVVQRHQHSVWRFLRFLGCDPALADDLTQDAFLVLVEAKLPDRGPAALDAWLRGTAHNLMRARRRRLRRELTTATPDELEAAWQSYARDDAGERYRAALRACIDGLSERQRQVVEMRWSHNARREEIAAAAGVGVEGAKSLLRRIKEALRHCIQKRVSDEPHTA